MRNHSSARIKATIAIDNAPRDSATAHHTPHRRATPFRVGAALIVHGVFISSDGTNIGPTTALRGLFVAVAAVAGSLQTTCITPFLEGKKKIKVGTMNQTERNENIRRAFAFMKYTERIMSDAPWAYAHAKVQWLTAIVDGMSSDEIDPTRVVTKDTEMRHITFTEYCSQGPTLREGWIFPWEIVPNEADDALDEEEADDALDEEEADDALDEWCVRVCHPMHAA